tara:strand:+ start:341 stop:565 length:225 start_codon:yes stop_codon:yes gene_type:complete
MTIKELKEEIENNFHDYPQEIQDYINYLIDYNSSYFRLIIDTKNKLYDKEYKQAENDLANVIFNGLNVNGYEQE